MALQYKKPLPAPTPQVQVEQRGRGRVKVSEEERRGGRRVVDIHGGGIVRLD